MFLVPVQWEIVPRPSTLRGRRRLEIFVSPSRVAADAGLALWGLGGLDEVDESLFGLEGSADGSLAGEASHHGASRCALFCETRLQSRFNVCMLTTGPTKGPVHGREPWLRVTQHHKAVHCPIIAMGIPRLITDTQLIRLHLSPDNAG